MTLVKACTPGHVRKTVVIGEYSINYLMVLSIKGKLTPKQRKYLQISVCEIPFSTNRSKLYFRFQKNHTIRCRSTFLYLEYYPAVTRSLDLPERPELPERPPKYRKDQRIINWCPVIVSNRQQVSPILSLAVISLLIDQ